ncbi:hypothetical protein V2J09_001182 [Rumex salicifolius]
MASYIQLLILCLSLSRLLSSLSASDDSAKSYIVYMGGSNGEEDIKVAESAHLHFLSSVISRENGKRVKLGHVFYHAFRGFSAMLTDKEASLISGNEGVVSVFPDRKLKLHTTRSWDFLAEEEGIPSFHQYYQSFSTADDVIIGVIDTGIIPESPSFSDKGIAEIPPRWKGVCMIGSDSNKNFCNRKLIGARYYDATNQTSTPRDQVGHGTHTASTAAGSKVANAGYFGLAKGTARGGLTTARIAAYKVCSEDGCPDSVILKGIDDALKDGVDFISASIGADTSSQTDFQNDPIAIGSFHAQQMGVMVVCAAGNEGPEAHTVTNTAPWLLTVAASTIDRDFVSTIVLGNGLSFKGNAISISNMTKSGKYPLAYAGDLAADSTPESEASNCMAGSLDNKRAAGKIILCIGKNGNAGVLMKKKKLVVKDAGGIGMVYASTSSKGKPPFNAAAFPFIKVGDSDGQQILNYINSIKNPTATILASVTVPRIRSAPLVADFSSRGPETLTQHILKPDIMAPGVAILAAVVPENGREDYPIGQKPSKFGFKSGTSMACPHVTAITKNNMQHGLTNGTGETASPHEAGVGEISPIKALNPGLVFPTTTEDYRYFLCYYGYSTKVVQDMTSKTDFKCPKGSSESLISNINYPTISIGEIKSNQKRIIRRKVMNVGFPDSVYSVTVDAPPELKVSVSPKKIVFREGITKASFNVTFVAKFGAHQEGYKFGSLTWSDGKHDVRVVFAVNLV